MEFSVSARSLEAGLSWMLDPSIMGPLANSPSAEILELKLGIGNMLELEFSWKLWLLLAGSVHLSFELFLRAPVWLKHFAIFFKLELYLELEVDFCLKLDFVQEVGSVLEFEYELPVSECDRFLAPRAGREAKMCSLDR